MAGYSIYICHITLDQVSRVRRELGLKELKAGRNPIASAFATVWLHTGRTKGSGSRNACVTMICRREQDRVQEVEIFQRLRVEL